MLSVSSFEMEMTAKCEIDVHDRDVQIDDVQQVAGHDTWWLDVDVRHEELGRSATDHASQRPAVSIVTSSAFEI